MVNLTHGENQLIYPGSHPTKFQGRWTSFSSTTFNDHALHHSEDFSQVLIVELKPEIRVAACNDVSMFVDDPLSSHKKEAMERNGATQ